MEIKNYKKYYSETMSLFLSYHILFILSLLLSLLLRLQTQNLTLFLIYSQQSLQPRMDYLVLSLFAHQNCHSFFDYYPIPQSILMTVVIFLIAILFSFVISYTTNMMDFTCQLVNNYLFCVLQFVFMTDTLLVELGGWRMEELDAFSSIESVLLMVLIIFNFASLILIPVKGLIEIVLEKVGGLLREMEKRGGKNKGRKGILGDNNVKILEFWKMERERQMNRKDESGSQSCSSSSQRSSQISLNDETESKREIIKEQKEQSSLDNFQ